MRLIDGLYPAQCVDFGRHLLAALTIKIVGDTHGDFVERVENIELGYGQASEAIHSRGIANYRRIEPAAPAGAAGDRAELTTQLPEALPERTLCLGRQRSIPHSSGVGLHHSKH